MSDLDRLREVGVLVRQPAFEELVETRRRRTSQARVAVTASLAVVGITVVGALAATGNDNRSGPPPIAPSTTTTETTESPETFEIPAGQQTITSDVGPGEVHGFDVVATVTNSQPEHRGDSELSVTVPDIGWSVSTYCRGASDLFYFYDVGDGGGGYGRCSPDADTALAPAYDIAELAYHDPNGGPRTVRMWIARPSAAFLDCMQGNSGDCGSLSDVPPVEDPDAAFGFGLYSHESTLAFELLENMGNGEGYPLEALSSIDGIGWLVDRAVVAAPGADRLAFEVPASDRDHLVDVYTGQAPHFDRCIDEHQDELPDYATTDSHVYAAAVDEICGVDVRLLVDGNVVNADKDPHAAAHFMKLGAQLAADVVHQVVVEVVRGDPRNIEYAVVVRVPTQIP
jgi:hypothetical protein